MIRWNWEATSTIQDRGRIMTMKGYFLSYKKYR